MAPLDIGIDESPILDRAEKLAAMEALAKKILWLSTWTFHNANFIREKRDGIKVGGHQASCASSVAILTALYMSALRPEDRVAVKPHASPVFHAIQYLFGNQTKENLENFRGFGGAQSYPSRTKDADDVDISTGSVGMGPAMTIFMSMVQDYLRRHMESVDAQEPGRMVALVGDAEMDEGNMYEALWEGWKHGLRNCWWIVDYNRQSLDAVVPDQMFRLIDRVVRTTGWRTITIKYGKQMMAAFKKPGGKALRRWINECPNDLYSALTFQGGAAWREQLGADLGNDHEAMELVASYDNDQLQSLMANLGGHCIETLMEAFEDAAKDDTPTCFIAYTIKGWGLPLAGHKDNHAGIMNAPQLEGYRDSLNIKPGDEWNPFAGMEDQADMLQKFLADVPFVQKGRRRYTADKIDLPKTLPAPEQDKISTQEAFGKILYDLAGDKKSALANRIVTTAPDVTQSTNLGGWVNRRGLFSRDERADTFRAQQIPSAQKWEFKDGGQHIELGIAENNLFVMLGALGLSDSVFGEKLFPIGTLYDPFIARGLDALNYACYQDARFMVVATPAGITLAPEGGAHQSISTPMIGMGQPGLTSFEPAFADELAEIMAWGFHHMQADDGGAVYLRLSTRPVDQLKRKMTKALREGIRQGGYWRQKPKDASSPVIIYTGAIAPEAEAAATQVDGAGLLAITSADRLFADWTANSEQSWIAKLLNDAPKGQPLVTVMDGHPATLSWLGGVDGRKVIPLGVDRFGQCGDLIDLYAEYGLDAASIVKATR